MGFFEMSWLRNCLMKKLIEISSCLTALFCFFPSESFCATNARYYDYDGSNAFSIKAVHDTLENVRHAVNNHEAEIRTFEERLKNYDAILDSLRDQLSEVDQAHKDRLKGNSATLETKIATLENTSKGLVADLRQFKAHANEVSGILEQYKQKIADLEKNIDQQNQNIDHLQAAMHALMEALQIKEPATSKSAMPKAENSTGRSYRVKSGDSLEKIARANQTTIQAIKELNHLSSDRIVIGQLLQLPEK